MSMLSAQIDKLRYEANMLRDHGTFIGYGGLTSTDPEMIECADLMCDAADTIWQLRDDLQRTNAENAVLRTQLADVTESMGRVEERCAELREEIEAAKHDLQVFSMSSVQLDADNAKLRKLLARVERARRDLCDAYPDAELLNCEECPAWSTCRGDLMDRMRELGVEVP